MSIFIDNDPVTNEDRLAHFDADRAQAERAAAELEHAVAYLPPVDNEGKSECVDAETLMAQKEEKAERVERFLVIMQEYVPFFDSAMSRTLDNLGQIRGAESSLHTQAPRQELSRGEAAAQDAYRRLAMQREKAIVLIERMTTAINQANQKQWPLGKPRKATPGTTSAGSRSAAPTQSGHPGAPTAPSLADEVAGIRSINSYGGSGHSSLGDYPPPATSLGLRIAHHRQGL